MKNDKKMILNEIFNSVNIPVIIEDSYRSLFRDNIVIEASSGIENFTNYPNWLNGLANKKYLIIKNIDYIYKEEQLKLVEILKYHKVGVNSLGDIKIILTVDKMDLNNIHPEIISLTAQV